MAGIDDELPPARADAVHRALLSGLLGNTGVKTDHHEYTTVRGAKFNIFPSSVLFKNSPQWLTSAELVETTRLYARTNAAVRPEWVEHAAAHLVRRVWSEPAWDRHVQQVMAHERVTLYGLVLFPARRSHYGPVDPIVSRQVFITHALVRAELRTQGEFLRHNVELVRQVRGMEARLRSQNLLAEERQRYDFYDRRIPADMYSVVDFERWRQTTERANRRLLFMTLADVLAPGAAPVDPSLFPDTLRIDELTLALEYKHDTGDPADGLTVVIPVDALGAVPPARFEWLVPGMLEEKVRELIRSLPKELRKELIPAADVARKTAEALEFGRGSLHALVANALGKIAGQYIPPAAFDLASLPPYLRMNFRVVDAAGKTLSLGRDLSRIRGDLRGRLHADWGKDDEPAGDFHRDRLTRWDFGDLPEKVTVYRRGLTLWGYPTLVDQGESVSLRLADSAEEAAHSMHNGTRRLFMLQVERELRDLSRAIPAHDEMCLNFSPVGACADLTRDLLTAAADAALYSDRPPLPRTQPEFAAIAEAGWRNLRMRALETFTAARQILATYHEIHLAVSEAAEPALLPAYRDVRDQLARLIYPGFLSATPLAWRRHLPRFLAAIQFRLRKLRSGGLTRDAAALAEVAPLWQRWKRLAADALPSGDAVVEFRWLIEELRVSLFAQELKTSTPVSVPRLERLWTRIESGESDPNSR